jgi:localization factor PodJL
LSRAERRQPAKAGDGARSIEGGRPRDILVVDAMKSNAPWSVKGIERDARETAKAAAQREGMTVGEWLNQTIYTAGDPNAQPTTGEIEGLKARDLAAAIEHLSRRIAASEAKSAEAVEMLARSLGGAVERLQRLERAEPGVAANDDGLAARLEALEAKSTDRQRIEALRALERAVGQIAVQFDSSQKAAGSRLDSAERQLQAIAARLEQGGGETVSAGAVRDAIEGMAERITRAEKIASEAVQLKTEANESVDADFIHKTGIRLRILGDEIKRGGDQIRTLETTITRLSQQIDAAEKRSAEGVAKVAETIADLRQQFSAADATDQSSARAEIEAAVSEIAQRTDDRIATLQHSFDAMVRRLEAAGGRAIPADEGAKPEAVAEPAPPRAAPAPVDDLDAELEDAFAALELEEPIPTPAIKAADAALKAEPTNEDDFGFDLEEPSARGAGEGVDPETEDVLAEIRDAFGLGDGLARPAREFEEPQEVIAAKSEVHVQAAEPPPVVAETPAKAPAEASQADYLKAARQAAREAAAKAAEEQAAAGSGKRKLTPKQRAILAARIKKRKEDEANAKARAIAAETPGAMFDDDAAAEDADGDEANSVKARVKALIDKIKTRPAAKTSGELKIGSDDEEESPKADPSLLGGASSAIAKLKKIPNAGGVLGLGVAILLAALAAVFFLKDLGRGKPSKSAQRADSSIAAEPAAEERFAPTAEPAADAAIKPRDLYLENIAALKSATNDNDARAALTHIEEAAALGHPPAQLQIGELYKLGQLYDRDLGQARIWFERAANGGNVLAMHRLGVMAARGEGGPVDPAASVKWFEMAAGFGLVDSQYNLGATFHPTADGAAAGVQDRAKAYFWYSVAAKNGDAQAGEMAAGLAASMPPAEKSSKDAEVVAWAPKTPDPLANELAPET